MSGSTGVFGVLREEAPTSSAFQAGACVNSNGVQQYGSGELFYIMEQAASRPLDESVQPLQPPHFRQAALHTDESAVGNLVQGDAHNIEHGYAAPPGAAPCHGYGAVSAYDSGCGASGYYGGTTYHEGGGSYAGAGYYMDASGTPVPITFPVGSAGGDEGYYGYAGRDGYAYGDVEYADVPHGYAPQAYDGAGDHAAAAGCGNWAIADGNGGYQAAEGGMSFANAAVLGCPEAYPGASAISYPPASTGYDFSGSSYTAPPLAGAATSLGHAVQTAVPATGGGYRVVAQAVPLGHWQTPQQPMPAKPAGSSGRGKSGQRNGPERKEWTAEEDDVIRTGVATHGLRWRKIAQMLPGRSDDAVRNRWNRLKGEAWEVGDGGMALSGAVEGGGAQRKPAHPKSSAVDGADGVFKEARVSWTRAEDAIIVNSVAEVGHKWFQIAQRLPGRTDHAIRNRYHRLQAMVQDKRPSDSELEPANPPTVAV